jgi:hypothetical protein
MSVVNSIHRRLSRRNRRENGWSLVVILVSGTVFAFTLTGLIAVNVNLYDGRCRLNFAAFAIAANAFHITIDRMPRHVSRVVIWSRAIGGIMMVASVVGVPMLVLSNGHRGAVYTTAAVCQYVVFFAMYVKLALLGFALFGRRVARSGDPAAGVNDDPFAYRTA